MANGVEISKAQLGIGDEVILSYSGLLAKSGADIVYAHIGYGEKWKDKAFIPMEKQSDVFKAIIKIDRSDDLNIAFKDGGDNWDNNSLANYSFRVKKKPGRTASQSVSAAKPKKTQKKSTTSASRIGKSASSSKNATTKTTAQNQQQLKRLPWRNLKESLEQRFF